MCDYSCALPQPLARFTRQGQHSWPGRCLAESELALSSPAKLKTGSQKLKPSQGTGSRA